MKTFILFLLTLAALKAGSLRVEVSHRFGEQPLVLDSLRYQGVETFSVSRLSYLLSEFAIQGDDGSWHDLPNQFAFIDTASRRTSFTLTQVPAGHYQSFRFKVGLPNEVNHSNPAQFPATHPLNPNLNRLHWTWAEGYIFLALEGKYRTENGDLRGFVYHLANDHNLTSIQLATKFQVKKSTTLALNFDLQKLHTLSFTTEGNSTHSHQGDPIATTLAANLKDSFQVRKVLYQASELPRPKITPLHLPEKFTPYRFKLSRHFPIPDLPRDNPLTEERVALGKSLFHNPVLSQNGMVSCATCHDPARAFTDGLPLSKGVEGRAGDLNSMPLFNLAWKTSFFWDGRAKSLREQVLQPIEDHREMASDLTSVVEQLEETERPAFEEAFGSGEITSEKIALALENFLLTLTSYDSKFDRAAAGKEKLTASEQRGMELFFTEYEPRTQQYGADCFHCHGGANFSDHSFHNNGLEDPAKFATPSLRNLTLTAPYMHDGRFATLEEVVAHYSGPMHQNDSLDPNLAKHPKEGLQLSPADQASLVAFLKTLTQR